MDMNFFGTQVEAERKLAQLSIPELSQKTGLAEDVITNIENGTLFPDVRHLLYITRALGLHEGHFLSKLFYTKRK